MRKSLLLLSALMLVSLLGCKTSEKNYREAYERTMARDSARLDFDETIYGSYRRDVREVPVGDQADSLVTRLVAVTVTPDGGGINEWLKRYCVVVGEFKQLFNASSMRERLVDTGVPTAFVVQTREPYYYVLAGSYADLPQATEMLSRMSSNPPFRLPVTPYLLTPTQLHWVTIGK